MSQDTAETHNFLACIGCSTMIVIRQARNVPYVDTTGTVTFATTYCKTCNDDKITIPTVMETRIQTVEDLKQRRSFPSVAADMVINWAPFKLVNAFIVQARFSNAEDLLVETGFQVPLVGLEDYRKLFPPVAKISSVDIDEAEWTDRSVLPYLSNGFC